MAQHDGFDIRGYCRLVEMQPTEKQLEILAADGHLLVMGGPGSGKTTVSILKAAQIAERKLRAEQKVLFLSFARATVSRVVEAIEFEQRIPREFKRQSKLKPIIPFFAYSKLPRLSTRPSEKACHPNAARGGNLAFSYPP